MKVEVNFHCFNVFVLRKDACLMARAAYGGMGDAKRVYYEMKRKAGASFKSGKIMKLIDGLYQDVFTDDGRKEMEVSAR